MHLPLPAGPPDDEIQHALANLEFGLANWLINFRSGHRPTPRATLPLAHQGAMEGFCSVLYDPDDEFFRGAKPRCEAFQHLLEQLDQVEAEAAGDPCAEVARSGVELERIAAEGKLAVVHAMEGGHGMGGDAAKVATLAARGVRYLIPAHLFYRGVATCVNAFPNLADPLFHILNPQPKTVGLKPLGRDIVTAAFEAGMLVDITHCSEKAIQDVFALSHGRPVISSHTGARATADYPINLSAGTIRKIRDSGGIVGVILYAHWLRPHGSHQDGIELVLRAIDAIHDAAGTYECIAIGSDFDGFIQPIAGVEDFSKLPLLEAAIEDRYPAAADGMIRGNARRVLREGWT